MKELESFIVDQFLADEPDCPVFGLNLACAYPFPNAVGRAYENLTTRLATLGPSIYVYPLWETHVTIATLVNFSLHRRPSEPENCRLNALAPRVIRCLQPLAVNTFRLHFQAPVLTRKAAIIPISNPTGEIARIRADALQLIEQEPVLRAELVARGMTIPQIIHSTIMRFARAVENPVRLSTDFEAIAATTRLGEIEVREILLTEETKPYMREGKVLHRFAAGT